jgi:hemerythrin-like metal-binding protein
MNLLAMEAYPLVGIEELDEDHRTLGAVVGRLAYAIKDDDRLLAAGCAEALLVQAAQHCAHEQRLMREIGYPALARHRRAHERFLATARDMLAEVRERGLTAAFLRWVAQLQEWFRSHVITEDLWLAQAIEKARALPQEERAVRT